MSNKSLSIIVPTLNERENIEELLRRIHSTLTAQEFLYEVIVVDDRSNDGSDLLIEKLSEMYPVRFYRKQGKRGKAFSLIEGFSYAKHDVLAYIDADLQYPPEVLPQMYEQIQSGFDVVVAERKYRGAPFIRNLASNVFTTFFGKFLHNLPYDVQSGQKMFRSEVVRRFKVNPSPWTFDLEFLLKAQYAGYSIVSHPVEFSKRNAGVTKINLTKATYEIGLSAIKLKFKDFGAIPFSPEYEKEKGKGFHYKSIEYVNYTDLEHEKSALIQLNLNQKIFLTAFAIILVTGLLIDWHATFVIGVAILTFVYFLDLFFNFFLIYRSFSKSPEVKVSKEEIARVPEQIWPTYTILCPLYKEWAVIPQFVEAIEKLDYPVEKLQVMLLLEEDDTETLEHVKNFSLPKQFSVEVVPHSIPKTKPKALNYGIGKATGEYVVVYDAEDVPDPLQLKKTIIAFHKVPKNIICIQAKLNFYNPYQNILTRVFTAEYALWFDLVLTGLQSIHAPIPLGGTSNHFRLKDIHALKGWDSFNVTEDADLGMRLVKNGYQTAIIDSETHEEANSDLKNWFWQRTRWIKGYMQTYLVHMRTLHHFVKNWKNPQVITFQLVIGGKVLSMFINPFMWLITISYFVFRPIIGPTIESFYPAPVLYMALFSLIIGNFLYMYYYMIGCAKRNYDDIIKYAFLIPLYWLAMSVAAWTAVYLLIRKPHHWSKTKHGLHLNAKKKIDVYSQKEVLNSYPVRPQVVVSKVG